MDGRHHTKLLFLSLAELFLKFRLYTVTYLPCSQTQRLPVECASLRLQQAEGCEPDVEPADDEALERERVVTHRPVQTTAGHGRRPGQSREKYSGEGGRERKSEEREG